MGKKHPTPLPIRLPARPRLDPRLHPALRLCPSLRPLSNIFEARSAAGVVSGSSCGGCSGCCGLPLLPRDAPLVAFCFPLVKVADGALEEVGAAIRVEGERVVADAIQEPTVVGDLRRGAGRGAKAGGAVVG
jgi:hypothetical protein